METNQLIETANPVISTDQLLEHWQGHRRLTRRAAELFPEDKFFNYSIGGMRPFSKLLMEMIDMADVGIIGLATGKWKSINETAHFKGELPTTKSEMLNKWDEVTEQMNEFWPQITPDQFQQTVMAFEAYEGTVLSTILYLIDNEIHHRAQGYVYLRSLDITPPPFWER